MLKRFLLLTSLTLLIFTGCTSKKEVAIVNENGKYGTLENSNSAEIKPIYDNISSFDDAGNKNVKTEHPNVINLHWINNYYGNEYAIVKYEGKYGIVTRDNRMVVKPIYDSITKLFNGFSVIKLDDKYGYLNNKFEVVQKPIFKKAREFMEDAAFVQSNANGKWGCITKEMNLKINDTYDEVYAFNEGLARTVKDGKWGFINTSCEVVAEPKFDYAYDFSNGYAKVENGDEIAYINAKGEEIVKPVFSEGENF